MSETLIPATLTGCNPPLPAVQQRPPSTVQAVVTEQEQPTPASPHHGTTVGQVAAASRSFANRGLRTAGAAGYNTVLESLIGVTIAVIMFLSLYRLVNPMYVHYGCCTAVLMICGCKS